MTPGVLVWHGTEASISPDGWQSGDERLATVLRSLHAPPSTEAGTPWVIAFWAAVKGLGAAVKQEPEPDPWPPEEEAEQ